MPTPAVDTLRKLLQSKKMQQLLTLAVAAISFFLVALFFYTALRRIRYPFEVEWVESNVLLSVQRVVNGLPLYARPTTDFCAFLYAPLYFYVCAFVAKLTGVSYVTLRLVSILSTLGSFAAIYYFVWSETRRHVGAMAAAGLFGGLYVVCQTCYDFGRVDALFIFLLLVALIFCRRGHPLLAALVWVLVCQTKQSLLPVAVFILIASYWRKPVRIVMAAGGFLALYGGSVLFMNRMTEGWYSFYIFGGARALPPLWRQAMLYWPQMIFAPLPVVVILLAAALIITPVPLKSRTTIFYAATSFMLFCGLWYVYSHAGAVPNALMPVFAWSCILFGVSINRLLSHFESLPTGAESRSAIALLLLAAFVQLFLHVYNPGGYIPTKVYEKKRWSLVEQVRAIPGDVYFVDHNADALLAGKRPHAEYEALGLFLGGKGLAKEQVTREWIDKLNQRSYSAVVSDLELSADQKLSADRELLGTIRDNYPLVITAAGSEPGMYLTSQPRYIYLPCSALTWDLSKIVTPEIMMDRAACPTP